MNLLQIIYEPFGFDLAFFILGMAGGFIRTITHDGTTLRQGLINVVVGGFAANYFTLIFVRWIGLTGKEYLFAGALLLGFFAVGVFVIFEQLETWAKKNPKNFLAFLINGASGILKHIQSAGAETKNKNNESGNDDNNSGA